ncbi:unnamed protein product, partial [Meganyctiphanes norvegica]
MEAEEDKNSCLKNSETKFLIQVRVQCDRPTRTYTITTPICIKISVKILIPTVSLRKQEVNSKVFKFIILFINMNKLVDIYNLAARPIVENVLEGYNGTIFAYGQTGTGKTFTMEGVRSVPELKGIIPNSFAHIFGHIAKAEEDKKFLVRVSYLEIYNEEVRDLLRQDQSIRLEVKERPDVGVYVKDLLTHVVHNADEMDKIMTLGNKNRAVGATHMNQHSSRSHAIFTITIECAERDISGQQHWRVGKLHLVDLAKTTRWPDNKGSSPPLRSGSKVFVVFSPNILIQGVHGQGKNIFQGKSQGNLHFQAKIKVMNRVVMCRRVKMDGVNLDMMNLHGLQQASRQRNKKSKHDFDRQGAIFISIQENEAKILKSPMVDEKESDPKSVGFEEVEEDKSPEPKKKNDKSESMVKAKSPKQNKSRLEDKKSKTTASSNKTKEEEYERTTIKLKQLESLTDNLEIIE